MKQILDSKINVEIKLKTEILKGTIEAIIIGLIIFILFNFQPKAIIELCDIISLFATGVLDGKITAIKIATLVFPLVLILILSIKLGIYAFKVDNKKK